MPGKKIYSWIRYMTLLVLVLTPVAARGQLTEAGEWAVIVRNQYRVLPNITYLTANNWDAKLDLYIPRDAKEPTPVIVYIHGGGWVGGTKEDAVLGIFPYLEMGLAVVNVEYRLGRVSLAPAAVEDCRCALRWVIEKAKDYNFDTDKIVVTGNSAGGHLALTTGMLPVSAGLDRQCYGTYELKVAAIINFYGITDVADLIDGPNIKDYAVKWLGSLPDREEIAKRVSPINYIRKGLPPIFSIHGNADPTVPYEQAVRLHEALDRVKVPNQLMTIQRGKHGNFDKTEMVKIFFALRQFLTKNGILKSKSEVIEPEPKRETKQEVKPEPTREVISEPKPEAKPDAKSETPAESKPAAKPEDKPEPKPETKPEEKKDPAP